MIFRTGPCLSQYVAHKMGFFKLKFLILLDTARLPSHEALAIHTPTSPCPHTSINRRSSLDIRGADP